eukprot:12206913-Alexandrium_andersonii.AAC.1
MQEETRAQRRARGTRPSARAVRCIPELRAFGTLNLQSTPCAPCDALRFDMACRDCVFPMCPKARGQFNPQLQASQRPDTKCSIAQEH